MVQNWTIGATKGLVQLNGEVDSKSGFGFGFFGQKYITPWVAGKLQLGMGRLRGMDEAPSDNWLNHPVWNGTRNPSINYNNTIDNKIFANYQTNYIEANLFGVFTISQIPRINNKSDFDGFIQLGVGAMRYETAVDAANITGEIYDFSSVNLLGPNGEDRGTENLNAFFDGNYETRVNESSQITPVYHVGAGASWKINNNLSVSLAHNLSFMGTDEVDSYQWDANNNVNNRNDVLHNTHLSLYYTFYKKKASVPFYVTPTLELPMLVKLLDLPEVAKYNVSGTFYFEYVAPQKVVEKVELTKEEEKVIKRAFDNLEFETDKAVIRNTSLGALTELANLLISHPEWKLSIAGHTDNIGSPESNMILSQQRAEAVKNYLLKKGITEDRFIITWFGQTQPIADNDTEAGRQKNRRVEMEIVE
ncbi:MAG: OmpA family protein [Bacteroidota bacterium]